MPSLTLGWYWDGESTFTANYQLTLLMFAFMSVAYLHCIVVETLPFVVSPIKLSLHTDADTVLADSQYQTMSLFSSTHSPVRQRRPLQHPAITALSVGTKHVLALTTRGTVLSWGVNGMLTTFCASIFFLLHLMNRPGTAGRRNPLFINHSTSHNHCIDSSSISLYIVCFSI